MGFINLRLTVPAAHAEALTDTLTELGALTVSIEDSRAGTAEEAPIFGEPGMPEEALWDSCAVTALFEADANVEQIAKAAYTQCGISPAPFWEKSFVEEQDWVSLTQAQFAPIRVSDRLWIVPTWHQAPEKDAINIALDPGVAFGTGSHPTTALCLQWLEANITGGETVLDYGCGSGILAIVAMKLGAASAVGVDIDAQAVQAARANAAQNAVAIAFHLPDQQPATPATITVANILANPLRVLAPLLAGATASGGKLALSGILAEQAEDIMAIYAPWFAMSRFGERDGWVCLQGVRR